MPDMSSVPLKPTPPGRFPPTYRKFCDAALDWARTSGVSWIYILKAITAALLALGISMKLELPAPRTAMTTVFVLMQPQSGMVLAKSLYRFCGTIVGLVAMLVFMDLFAQQPEMFLGATALWIGICTAGAARNRNFRSYGFVLAGYTAALIGIPAWQHPDGAFLSAVARGTEVTMGVICAGLVSALIFPQHVGKQLRKTIRDRFREFSDFTSHVLSRNVAGVPFDNKNAQFVADAVSFEAARSAAVFETPETRRLAGRLLNLNNQFMTMSTRLHALQHLVARLRTSGQCSIVAALSEYTHEISLLFATATQHSSTSKDVTPTIAKLGDDLNIYRRALPPRIASTRATFIEPGNKNNLLDFDTAIELLYRFIDEFHAYAQIHASLEYGTRARALLIQRYESKTPPVVAAVAGLRAMALTLILSWFWIASAWPSGTILVLNGGAVCALVASAAKPSRIAYQMAIGTVLACITGFISFYWCYPRVDGFPMLCVILAPALTLGCWMTTRPQLAGYGVGYCIYFCFLAAPDNLVHYDPAAYLNGAISLSMSMFAASVAHAVILPPSTSWIRNHLLDHLRRQVAFVCDGRIPLLRSRFESRVRDLMSQIQNSVFAKDEPEMQPSLWFFSVLEIGNCILDLRQALPALASARRVAEDSHVLRATAATCRAVATLFLHPSVIRLESAKAEIGFAITALQDELFAERSPQEVECCRQMLVNLHFLRSALLDSNSPLTAMAMKMKSQFRP
jgi:uncharacterized membrane protein YccC